MVYNKDIPQGSVSPKDQVAAIRGNFASFASAFYQTSGGVKYNHGELNTKSQGKHEVVLMEKQSSDPIVIDATTALYVKDVATTYGTTQPQLFARVAKFLPNEVPNDPMQISYNAVNTAGPVYQSFLPGGYLIYFGTTNDTSVVITLLPKPSSVILAMAPCNDVNGILGPYTSNAVITQPTGGTDAKITINTSAPIGKNFSWMAIAKQ